jgi:molybdopterin synthase catalytic subunit
VVDLSSVKHAGIHPKGTVLLTDIIDSVKARPDYHKVGAIVTFTGVVRGITKEGEPVQHLQLEAYEENADQILEKICTQLKRRKDIIDVQIHHLTGEFELGEDLVYVLVAGGHRESVFPVLEEAVERFKKEAPIFKKEYVKGVKGRLRSYWVSEAEDRR